MQSMLKEKMERIRMNPRRYFHQHIDDFELLDDMNFDEILMLFISSIGYGQETKLYFEATLEALNRLLDGQISDISKVYYYNIKALGERYNGNFDLSIEYFFESYTLALKIHEVDLAARALIGVSVCFNMKGNLESAYNVSQQTLKMSVNIDEYSILGDIFGNYASYIKRLGNIDGAFDAYHTAKMHYEKLPNYEEYVNYCVIIGNIALTYIELERFDEAEQYVKELLRITKDDDDFFMISQGAIEVIADYYAHLGDFYNANLLNKKLIKLQSKQNLHFHTKTKHTDSQVVSQIVAVENLRKENEQLASENAMLHDKIAYETPETLEIFKSVAEGLRKNAFIPYFQEVWEPESRQVTGYEVLVRWKKSEDVILSPVHFIDFIEDSPLIVDLSEQLIRQGLEIFSQQMKAINNTQRSISFNISPYQLVNQDLVKLLEALCIEFSVPKRLVVIEIIERTFIDNNSVAINQLHALKKAGFKLALDDFGTGYSSLASIAELPLDLVKIDRSLVREITAGGKPYQLFQGIIYIIKSLGLTSLAEGIETEEQLESIRILGCDRAQGYFMHRPSAEIR